MKRKKIDFITILVEGWIIWIHLLKPVFFSAMETEKSKLIMIFHLGMEDRFLFRIVGGHVVSEWNNRRRGMIIADARREVLLCWQRGFSSSDFAVQGFCFVDCA